VIINGSEYAFTRWEMQYLLEFSTNTNHSIVCIDPELKMPCPTQDYSFEYESFVGVQSFIEVWFV
jgi:hypothetical protein